VVIGGGCPDGDTGRRAAQRGSRKSARNQRNREPSDPATIFELVEHEAIITLCAAPTVLIGIANAPPVAAIERIERGLAGFNRSRIFASRAPL
jgi:hypothetical protein